MPNVRMRKGPRRARPVQQGLTARAEEVGRVRRHEVERARYEVEFAQKDGLQRDPEKRLVADAWRRI